MSKTRFEAFTDGVIAVIITIMVLNIKVPAKPTWQSLTGIGQNALVYVISFILIFSVWISHHRIMLNLHSPDTPLLWINAFFLLSLSFAPLSTAWVGHYIMYPLPEFLFSLNSLCNMLMIRALSNHVRYIENFDKKTQATYSAIRGKTRYNIILAFFCCIISFFVPLLAFVVSAGIAIYWILNGLLVHYQYGRY